MTNLLALCLLTLQTNLPPAIELSPPLGFNFSGPVLATNTVWTTTNTDESSFDPSKLGNFIYYNKDMVVVGDGYGSRYATKIQTEKWLSSVVTEHHRLDFLWNGRLTRVDNDVALSTNVVHLKLKQDWEEVK